MSFVTVRNGTTFF